MKRKLLKTIIANFLTKKGKKHLGEMILKNTAKKSQKFFKKQTLFLLKLGLLNTTNTFVVRNQTIKRGKKKNQKKIYVFLKNKQIRVKSSVKELILSAKKKEFNKFSENLFKSFERSAKQTKNHLKKNSDMMLEISSQKKYISKFKW